MIKTVMQESMFTYCNAVREYAFFYFNSFTGFYFFILPVFVKSVIRQSKR